MVAHSVQNNLFFLRLTNIDTLNLVTNHLGDGNNLFRKMCLSNGYVFYGEKQKKTDNQHIKQRQRANCEDENEEDNYELAKIIYCNAIKAIPNDASFHLYFITICKLFPDTCDLQCLIMNTIREEFDDIRYS